MNFRTHCCHQPLRAVLLRPASLFGATTILTASLNMMAQGSFQLHHVRVALGQMDQMLLLIGQDSLGFVLIQCY